MEMRSFSVVAPESRVHARLPNLLGDVLIGLCRYNTRGALQVPLGWAMCVGSC